MTVAVDIFEPPDLDALLVSSREDLDRLLAELAAPLNLEDLAEPPDLDLEPLDLPELLASPAVDLEPPNVAALLDDLDREAARILAELEAVDPLEGLDLD